MHSSKDDKLTDAASREVDDYNPKVKLEELLLSCGMPILEVELQNSSDGSASAKVVDKNDTLVLWGKCTQFVHCLQMPEHAFTNQ